MTLYFDSSYLFRLYFRAADDLGNGNLFESLT